MPSTTLFFDLDDTLYTSTNGLWDTIRDRMGLYMAERMGMPAEQISELRRFYYQTYGTTLRGLQHHHQVDVDEYLAYVHDIPLDQYIQPNPEMREMLLSLPHPRWVFTNADDRHAERVLGVLGLQGCFDGVIDVRVLNFACKPEAEAFRIALERSGNPNPADCILFDDSRENLAGARRAGFQTVWVGAHAKLASDAEAAPFADARLGNLLEMRERMPRLWVNGQSPDGGAHG